MVTTYQAPYPEWLERGDDDQGEQSPWSVTSGPPTRGEAWTDIDSRRMRVPMGSDDMSRAIRAHEMVHAKMSPKQGPFVPLDDVAPAGATVELMEACEEARVNHLASVAGFNMKHLKDGNEAVYGEAMAAAGDHDGLLYSIVAMEGTGGITPFMRGVRKAVDEGRAKPAILEHAKAVRKITKATLKYWSKPWVASDISSTDPYGVPIREEDGEYEYEDVPRGYVEGTCSLAYRLRGLLRGKSTRLSDFAPDEDAGDIPDEGGSNAFAPLLLDDLPLTRRVAGRLGRKRIASNTGKDPRRINRMLTDPERRVFDRRAKGLGGVVLIDQSGSMSLSDSDIWDIIKAAPGCVIIGYSHGSRDEPNCWVLADRGKVVEHVRRGNGGNGVDGPALLFALSKRRNKEPVIWVCDGYVTAENDGYIKSLAKACAKLVRKHGVHMVENVPSAVTALGRVSRGETLNAQLTGPMAYEL